jgi:iduronate 2-sulfatase
MLLPMKSAGLLLLLGGVAAGAPPRNVGASPLRNVLMFAVDDLRSQLSIYPEGGAYMHTPNMERLAQRSVVFERAYVAVALCMPSRTALLTSRRPDTSRSWTIEADQWFRQNDTGAGWTTLPQAFKESGYLTLGMGKIFHEKMPADDPQDARISWSPEAFYPDGGDGGKAGGLYDPQGEPVGSAEHTAYQADDAAEPAMQDGNITDHAIATIERMANGTFGEDVASGERPFFLAVGLHKPHIPWICPKRFFAHYPIEGVPPVPHPTLPGPAVSAQDWQMRGACNDVDMAGFCANMSDGRPMGARYPLDGQALSAAGAAHQRQAYFACVSWTDANVGRVLDAFEKTQFAANDWNGTVLVFWGDHGYHLGDNDIWEKMTNYEHATKIPLMIGCGGADRCVGRSAALVETLDIMPTILEEAGVVPPTPPGAGSAIACAATASASRLTPLCTEGRSLSAVLRAPRAAAHSGTNASLPFGTAYSQFPRPEHPQAKVDLSCRDANLTLCKDAKTNPMADGWCNATGQCPNKMGYSVRTDKYRYTVWVAFNKCTGPACPPLLADWSSVHAVELYNHSDAPALQHGYGVETENIAGLPSSAAVQAELHTIVHDFNTRGAA